MKKQVWFMFLMASLLPEVVAQNPIIQTNYTADPAPMVHNNRVYLYPTHDEDSTIRNFFTMNDWRCYSSGDMVNWTDHGSVLSYKDFDWARGDAWAGQCIFRDGKFYFYVPVNQKNGGNAIGVAVSESPAGPFKDALGKPLLVGYGYIDPTVFIDGDGQAYLYWGNPNLWHVKLNKDMISYDTGYGIVKEDLKDENFGYRSRKIDKRMSSYEEGPWLYKRNNLYYLFYPAGGVPEHLAYSTSNSLSTPKWVYGDTIMRVIEKGGAFTNHPGVIDYKGRTFLFYHNGVLPGGGGFKRSVCIDELFFNADGSVRRIIPSGGLSKGVDNLNPFVRNEAETIAWEEGIETRKDSLTGNIYVTEIHTGDYIKVRSVQFGKGAKSFQANIASVSDNCSIEIRIDNLSGNLLGNCVVSATGGLQNWKEFSCNIQKTKGIHDVYFIFKGNSGSLFNFDWWKFNGE